MPDRRVREMLAIIKSEVTYALDPVPTPAANAILLRNVEITAIDPNNVPRDLIRGYLGASEELVGTRSVQMTFSTEAVGSGTAAVAPKFAPLLQACGRAEAIEALVRVDYMPISTVFPSVTAYLYDSGVLHKFSGARGTARLRLVSGEMPEFQWTFRGLYAPITAAALPAGADFSGFKTPIIPTHANTQQLTLGATLNTVGAPVFTGGTLVPSLGMEIDFGNDVQFTPLIGGETVDIVERTITGNCRLDLTPAQEVTRVQAVLDATLSSIGILHGTAAGFRVGVFAPSAQFQNYRKDTLNGRRLQQFDLRMVPNPAGTGNDELRLVFY